jgi:hypothetical protein
MTQLKLGEQAVPFGQWYWLDDYTCADGSELVTYAMPTPTGLVIRVGESMQFAPGVTLIETAENYEMRLIQ